MSNLSLSANAVCTKSFELDLEQHLKDRYLDLDLHSPVLDQDNGLATFYLWTLSGKLAGYQQYRPLGTKDKNNDPREGKYYTYKTKPHSVTAFGMESLNLKPKVLFLTEGLFDAARLTYLGYPALATLSNDPGKDFRSWLWTLNRKVVAVCDNDSAGRKLAKYGSVAVFTEDKDLGDSSPEYVNWLLQTYGD